MRSFPSQALRRLGPALHWRVAYWRARSPALNRALWYLESRPRLVEVSGIRVRIGRHISPAMLPLVLAGRYERQEFALVRQTVRPGDSVLELGTGLGVLATVCALRLGSDRVVTYEANPALERHIRATFALNGVAPTLRMAMAGARDGAQTLYVMGDLWSSSSIRRSPTARAVEVRLRDVNRDLREFRPTVVIVDIEGGEVELIPELDLRGVRAIIIELHERVTGPTGVSRVKEVLLRDFRLGEGGDAEHCVFLRP